MGLQVSHLNTKFRKPLVWRLDGRAPAKFRMYKQDSSIRKDLPLFAAPGQTLPCSDVINKSDVTIPSSEYRVTVTRRLRRKRRQRGITSRGESSSSDSDERLCGVNENDIEVYLTESSLEYPGNIPMVLSSTCILYQTKSGGCQEELPLQLGLIVTGIFKNQNWIYVQTPHGEEGYVFYKHCMPLCILPVQKSRDTLTPMRKPYGVTDRKPYEDIMSNIEDLRKLGDVEKVSDGDFANVNDRRHERRWDASLTDSNQIIFDWNRNQLISEDVFDGYNGYIFPDEGGCAIEGSVDRCTTRNDTSQNNYFINDILADLVGNERSSTSNLRGQSNYFRSECSSTSDGGYFTEDIVIGKEMLGNLSNEALRVFCCHCSKNSHYVDEATVNVPCTCHSVSFNCTLESAQSGGYNKQENTLVGEHQNSLVLKRFGRVLENRNKSQEQNSKKCVCCFGNNYIEQDSMSASIVNMSQDFISPRHSSTPVSKLQSNTSYRDSRKTKKHCSAHCTHDKIRQPDPNVKGPSKQNNTEDFIDGNNYINHSKPNSVQYDALKNESHAFSNIDFTSQWSWERNPFPDANHKFSHKQSYINQRNLTSDYQFQTIEILQDPTQSNPGSKSNSICKPGYRVKKPCFKVHNQLDVNTNTTLGVSVLEDIVENEIEEQPKDTTNHNKPSNRNVLLESEPQSRLLSKTSSLQNCETYQGNNELRNSYFATSKTELKNIVSKTVDTLSTASYPLRRKTPKTNRSASVDNLSLCSERSIDDLFTKHRRRSRRKSRHNGSTGERQNTLMLITEDYYNEDDRFQVLKDEIVVLLNVYKSWLYVQTHKQQNGFIPSYVAAYAVV